MAPERRRPDPRLERTRTAVTSAASDLLLAGGVRAVTIEAVVEASGVARSTIYRHWPTRSEVVAAAFARLLPPTTPPPAEGKLADRLRAVMTPRVPEMNGTRYVPLVSSLLGEAARDPELADLREQFVRTQQAPLLAVLGDAVDAGELPAGTDLDEATSTLLGPLLFERLILGREIDPGFADRTIDGFLAHARA
ncbi:TetR/AcrR family transcriptional regulator [Isoptericola haloaureus]|uniref:TetR/AcrR family transcriptional regulator n=1 Tax=Isoptericola haloaureus TaxID=1542902 RepID=A0ABU7Z8K2_9MICO